MSDVVALLYCVKRFLLFLALGSVAWAVSEYTTSASSSLNIMWNQSADTNVQGYKVYYGTVSQQYTNVIVAGNVTNVTINGVQTGTTYYFAATSYNAAGWQSAYSPEIAYTVPAANATLTSGASTTGGFNFSIGGTAGLAYVILASTNLVSWVAIATNNAPLIFTDAAASQYSQRFYKAVLQSLYVPQVYGTPPAAAVLSATVYSSSGFRFNLSGTPGSPYVVETSTNLINWVAVMTNNAPFGFVDSGASQFSHRFYKAIPEP